MKAGLARFGVVCALLLGLAGLLSLGGCGVVIGHVLNERTQRQQGEAQVAASLARYRQLALDADAERAADCFTKTGELSHNDEAPHVGHDAILAFLKGAAGDKLQAYELIASSTTIDERRATQAGTYRRTVEASGGGSTSMEGRFAAEWTQQADGRWLLRRFHTASPG